MNIRENGVLEKMLYLRRESLIGDAEVFLLYGISGQPGGKSKLG